MMQPVKGSGTIAANRRMVLGARVPYSGPYHPWERFASCQGWEEMHLMRRAARVSLYACGLLTCTVMAGWKWRKASRTWVLLPVTTSSSTGLP